MNKVILLGRLTRDPETRYTQGSEPLAITKYGIAVNRKIKKQGEPDADFIECVAFGRAGEFAEKWFKKGMMVCVSGRLTINTYEDQNGQKRTSANVVLEDQDFAESKSSFESRTGNSSAPKAVSQPQQAPKKQAEPEGFYPIEEGVEDEDFPF